ncbi:43 kDa receptor-associated protein of the synapse [Vespula squamosa]|uniref:43 kDa receptor-associated protein of the synapse n=1 Tax=Vespula squamosa TaxID=30214 RepID=A0ABD2A6S2_VESSQ
MSRKAVTPLFTSCLIIAVTVQTRTSIVYLDKEIEEACMLKQSTFEVSEHSWKVLMVGERRGRSIPGEIQGLKGWPRRWIHSGNSYI